jgi:N-glycosylase/DNA lyase
LRARYVIDAARKAAGGQVDLEALPSMPLEEARECLRRIDGVGPKVADCALLFGFGRMECLPVDVWIGRAMDRLFAGCFPECALPWAGIAQQ